MRKIILAAFLLLVSVSFVSCNFAKRELKAKIEMANRECPVELGMFGKIENIKYDLENDEVVMTITYNGTMKLDLSALNKIKGPVKRGIMNDFVNNKDTETLLESLGKADSKFTVIYKSVPANDSLKITMSKEEVKDMANRKIEPLKPRELLDIRAEILNAQCPQQLDETTTITSVDIKGNYFVYNYTVDEGLVSVESMNAYKEEMKEEIMKTLKSNDPSIQTDIYLCKENHMGMIIRVIGDRTGNTCSFQFSSLELL